MKELLRKRITEMTALIGVSGYEWEVSKYISSQLRPYVDSLEVQPNGNLIAIKKGAHPGPRFVVSAHMDEVGYCVRAVDDKGFLYFDRIGGASEACIPGRRVLVQGDSGVVPGIIGVRAAHMLTPEEMGKPQTVRQSYIDIGVGSREEAAALGIRGGAQIVIDSPCQTLANSDYLNSRAMDCRVLCSIIIETLLRLKPEDIHGELCAIFSVLEESTINGVTTAINQLLPKYGLFLDTVPTGDVPDFDYERDLSLKIGGGPIIILNHQWHSLNRRVASHPRLVEALRQAGQATGSPYQEFAFNCGTYLTDASAAVLAGHGVATVTFGVGRRYSHSPVELIHLDDAVNCQRMAEEFIKTKIDLAMN